MPHLVNLRALLAWGCWQLMPPPPKSDSCPSMQIMAPVQPVAPVQVAQPPVHGSANAVLAAALSAGDFYAPTSPPPVSKRPDNEVNKAYAVLHLVKSFHFAVAMLHCLMPPNLA